MVRILDNHGVGVGDVKPRLNDGGAHQNVNLSVDEIKRLASIPSVDELRAKIIGLLQAPAAQLARVTKAYSEKDMAA